MDFGESPLRLLQRALPRTWQLVLLRLTALHGLSRGWQIARATALIQPHGGRIVAEFFDVDRSRSIPPQRQPIARWRFHT